MRKGAAVVNIGRKGSDKGCTGREIVAAVARGLVDIAGRLTLNSFVGDVV